MLTASNPFGKGHTVGQTSFERLLGVWTKLGDVDPLWAILSDPDKENGQWNQSEFFATGVEEIAQFRERLASLGITLPGGGAALDFGCGVGRLTQALSQWHDEAHGVDISGPMITKGRELAQAHPNCTLHLNQNQHLGLFPDQRFDFVYSRIVLQHMEPQLAQNYIREFIRVLKPGGICAFQVPSTVRPRDANPAVSTAWVAKAKAKLTVLSHPQTLRPNEGGKVVVRVLNSGTEAWTSEPGQEVRIGNHWLSRFGRIVINDDGRTSLPSPFNPGQSIDLDLTIIAPLKTGTYKLAIDLVKENVTWFQGIGHVPPRVTIKVKANSLSATTAHSTPKAGMIAKPAFEMHGISRQDVEAAVQQAGGRLLHILDDDSAGPHWISSFYIATK